MTPKNYFDESWRRCDALSAIHAFMASNSTGVISVDEILRAEWVARVSALDLYVHELVCQKMVLAFNGNIAKTIKFNSFKLPISTIDRIKSATNNIDASSAFELEIRRQIGLMTLQDPEKIADAIKLFSNIELWKLVARNQGATSSNEAEIAKKLKITLRSIVDRRNKIAHEADMQPTAQRAPWPISKNDLSDVSNFVKNLVNSIDACV